MQPLFEILDTGVIIPRWPMDDQGNEIEADGKQLLTAQQAAAISGESIRSHHEQFRLAYRKWLDEEVTPALVVEDAEKAKTKNGGVAPKKVRLSDDVFRDLFYPQFAMYPEQWDYFMGESVRRGLNPRSKEIFADLKYNEDTQQMELVMFTGIAGFRRILFESGKHAGNDEPQFVYGDDPYYPEKCVFTLYMMVEGQRCPFVGRAKWREFNPGGEPATRFREESPECWLSKMAEADAARRACPQRAGDLYVKDEFKIDDRRVRRTPSAGTEQKPTVAKQEPDWTEPEPVIDYDDDMPASEEGFNTTLIAFGFATPASRKLVKRQLQDRLTARSPQEYWAKAVRDLKANPQVYGAKVPSEAM